MEREEARLFRERADTHMNTAIKDLNDAKRFRRQGRVYFKCTEKERESTEKFHNAIGTFCLTLSEHQIQISNQIDRAHPSNVLK